MKIELLWLDKDYKGIKGNETCKTYVQTYPCSVEGSSFWLGCRAHGFAEEFVGFRAGRRRNQDSKFWGDSKP